ncbi:PRD domain-containing protein [Niallia circulans]|uniref:PRD domain-containing protein n=1 Tax=Niallia circulans TaxID=1397 RepID=UPI0026EDAD6F|nr:PRD domain-containing protein [Niallia circulans]
MLRINKILNNNAVVIIEEGTEKIVLGAGIAFQKGKNDLIQESKIEKIFILKNETKQFQELLESLPESYITIAEEIISYAEEFLEVELNSHIHIALTDHLAFAIDRMKKGIAIRNRLLSEVKILYPKEYEIGVWAINQVEKKLGIQLPIDEAGYIGLHIHTGTMNSNNVDVPLKRTMILQDLLDIVASQLNMEIDKDSLTYHRFLTHLEFVISRMEKNEVFHEMDDEMLDIVKSKYKRAYECSEVLAVFLNQEYQYEVPESEVGFLTLHIQRLWDKSNK